MGWRPKVGELRGAQLIFARGRGVGLHRECRNHATPFEIELGDLVEHVVAQLDDLARLARNIDLLGVVDDLAEIPTHDELKLEIAIVVVIAIV